MTAKTSGPPKVTEKKKRRTMTQKDRLEFFFERGLCLDERIIMLGSIHTDVEGGESGTDAAMFDNFYRNWRKLQYLDPSTPITVIMNNLGGSWYHGMGIYDVIQNSLCPITIEAYGHVMSMGSVILQAADRRLLARNATMMIHYGNDGFYGHTKDFMKTADEAKRICKVMEDIYLARIQKKDPTYTREQFEKFITYDKYLTASESIKLNLADGYIPKATNRIPEDAPPE